MRIHCVGIGGIGVSALARYYKARGHRVTGSDLTASEITRALEHEGIPVSIGLPEDTKLPRDAGKVVYSRAVLPEHPERKLAQERGVPEFSYPEALGELTREHTTIAVSGTHGKSTTTAMLGLLLERAGLAPTVILGTKLKEFGNTNFRMGGPPSTSYKLQATSYLVIEADEYADAFLHYSPSIIVLTSIEPDHLDYFGTFEKEVQSYRTYVSLLPEDGVLVANRDDRGVRETLGGSSNIFTIVKNIIWYSLEQPEAGRLRETLQVPGDYNISNALAALAAARELGVPDKTSFSSLGAYRGSWRRFEVFPASIKTSAGKELSYTLVSDYGHHPTEVKVTVEAARAKWPDRPLWLVFQPHQYHRTHALFQEFVQALSQLPVDRLILPEIYDVPGREDLAVKTVTSSRNLVEAIRDTRYEIRDTTLYLPTLQETERYLLENLQGGEVVMLMGAGNVYDLTLQLLSGKIGK